MISSEILEKLKRITEEEQAILDGRNTIDRELYMSGGNNDTINSSKLLDGDKLITVRPHTRFIHFPEHTHDYVELVYMCSGKTTHIINGKKIVLKEGELLFMSQHTRQEILYADEMDIAINFIVLPKFFGDVLTAIGEEETPLKRFITDCLCGDGSGPGYLLFRVSDISPIQNLIENLIWILINGTPKKRNMNQMTMSLLFLHLLDHTDHLVYENPEQAAVFNVLRYVEDHYQDCSLTDVASKLHYDVSWLSREIKRRTGKNYTDIVQEKRLSQAAFLLKNTNLRVSNIAIAVGYENISYFHRLFAAGYGRSPRNYRMEQDMQERTLF